MTPQEILELSEPVEQVYTDVVAQLVSNICRHLGQGKELSTQQWEIKKLSELDALTNESIKIIQNASGKSRAEIKRAIAEAMGVGVRDVEKVLKGAERAGAIEGIGFTAEQSDALKNLLSNLVNQAEDRANLVNTVMLNSTRQRYVWAVNNTATEEQKLIEKLLSARNAEELERQLGKVQTALNVATSSVEVGSESRVQALSRTVKQLAQEGITGYIDAGGHHWSPEAYMNMDIRTTVHNAYVQAQKERAAEHGVSTFQITSHAGARPLCAPYQGKFYSWDGSDGVLEDLHGNKHVYESIHATSYGQPAGIFGINCGHDPVTFVNGYSIPRYEPTQDAEQNAKEYAESQKQRQLERNVRQAKLEAISQDAAGNKEAFKTAAEKVRQANADYKAYCKETGRTPRNDRLQVYASEQGNGYNRSMSGKVTGTTRGWKPPETTPPTSEAKSSLGYSVKNLTDPVRPRKSDFKNEEEYYKAREAYNIKREEYNKGIQEAIDKAASVERFATKDQVKSWARSQGITVDDSALDAIDIRSFNESSYALDDLFKRFPEVKSYNVEYFDGTTFKTQFNIGISDVGLLSANNGLNFNPHSFQDYRLGLLESFAQQTDGFNVRGDGTFSTFIRHEYGHNVQSYIENKISTKYHNNVDDWRKNFSSFNEFKSAKTAYINERRRFESELRSLENLSGSSEYSNTNINELFAEGFAEYSSGGTTEFGKAFGEFLKRWY